jgi:hypothetical protein
MPSRSGNKCRPAGWDEDVRHGDRARFGSGKQRVRLAHPRRWACGAVGSASLWQGEGPRFDPGQVHRDEGRYDPGAAAGISLKGHPSPRLPSSGGSSVRLKPGRFGVRRPGQARRRGDWSDRSTGLAGYLGRWSCLESSSRSQREDQGFESPTAYDAGCARRKPDPRVRLPLVAPGSPWPWSWVKGSIPSR